MPVNTSMNRWSRIASNMDIETSSLINPSDVHNETPAERSQLSETAQSTKNTSHSNLQRISDDDL